MILCVVTHFDAQENNDPLTQINGVTTDQNNPASRDLRRAPRQRALGRSLPHLWMSTRTSAVGLSKAVFVAQGWFRQRGVSPPTHEQLKYILICEGK